MAIPRLRKWSTTVLKDKSGSDNAQIPAPGVTCTVYKKGSVVRTGTTVTNGASGVTVNVRDSTVFHVGDTLKAWSVSGEVLSTGSFEVVSIPHDFAIVVDSDGNGTVVLAQEDRLLLVGPSGRVPIPYNESQAVTLGTVVTDARGYVQAWYRERFVDVVLSGGSITTAFREGDLSGDDEQVVSAYNYPGGSTAEAIQNAIDDANNGATVIIPAGDWTIDTPILVNKSIHLKGDGLAETILYMDASKNVNCIEATEPGFTISDLKIQGPGGAGTGIGIRVGDTGGGAIFGYTIENIRMDDTPNYGLQLGSLSGGWGAIITGKVDNVDIVTPHSGAAFYGSRLFTTIFTRCAARCSSAPSGVYGYHMEDANVCVFISCEVNPSENTPGIYDESDSTGFGYDSPLGNTYIALDSEVVAPGSNVPHMVVENGRSVSVRDSYFLNGTGGAIQFDTTFGCTIDSCAFVDITGTEIDLQTATNTLILNPTSYGTHPGEAHRQASWAETSCVGTMVCMNGLIVPPRYATGSLPAATANKVINGSIAYDTTTNTLKVLASGSWVTVGTQT